MAKADSGDEPSSPGTGGLGGGGTYSGRIRLHFLTCVDVGFLLDVSTEEGRRAAEELTRARSAGPVAESFLATEADGFRLGRLSEGTDEKAAVRDRMADADRYRGKIIWSPSLLEKEAPVIFDLRFDGGIIEHNGVDFQPVGKPTLRFFPRGVIAIEYDYTADIPIGRPKPVEELIQGLLLLRNDVRAIAWRHVRDKVLNWPIAHRVDIDGHPAFWRLPGSEDTARDVMPHLVHHMIVLLEKLPGQSTWERDDRAHLAGINGGTASAMAVAGLVNLTHWFDDYSRTYVDRTLGRSVRNRYDEIYLTDSHISMIILQDFWRSDDPLKFYEKDLVLAVIFELCRLTHLRYQAHFMRTVVLDRELRDDRTRTRRESMSSVLQMQRILLRSSYEHPAERLIRHGFTRRFLEQLREERGVEDAVVELKGYIDDVSRAVELGTGLEVEEATAKVARRTYVLTVIAVLIALIALIPAVLGDQAAELQCPDIVPYEFVEDGQLACAAEPPPVTPDGDRSG